MKLTIGGKEYTFEFTVEASLNEECVEKVTSLFFKIGEAQSEQDVETLLRSVSNIPATSASMFYAGLLEHHGECGDNSVRSKRDAVELLKVWFRENTNADEANFYTLLQMLMAQMGDDGFFKRIGLASMMQTEEPAKKTRKKKLEVVPEDSITEN